jgi:hypothetical protein
MLSQELGHDGDASLPVLQCSCLWDDHQPQQNALSVTKRKESRPFNGFALLEERHCMCRVFFF